MGRGRRHQMGEMLAPLRPVAEAAPVIEIEEAVTPWWALDYITQIEAYRKLETRLRDENRIIEAICVRSAAEKTRQHQQAKASFFEQRRDKLGRAAEILNMSGTEFGRWLSAQPEKQIAFTTGPLLCNPDRTWGIEIEFNHNVNHVARCMYEAGLVVSPQVLRVHDHPEEDAWIIKNDFSVNDGAEVVSPPLRDNPESWEQLQKVCRILKELDCEADISTGLHVHLGSEILARSPLSLTKLYRFVHSCEDLIYRMTSFGGVHRGLVRRDRVFRGRHELIPPYFYAQPVGMSHVNDYFEPVIRNFANIRDRLLVDDNRLNAHYHALNCKRLFACEEGQRTVEFRHPNGTIDPVRIQSCVQLFDAITSAAESTEVPIDVVAKSADVGTYHENPENHELLQHYGQLFSRDADALDRAIWLYRQGTWQRPGGEQD